MNSPDRNPRLRSWDAALSLKGRHSVYGLTFESSVYFVWQWLQHQQQSAALVVPSQKHLMEASELLRCFNRMGAQTLAFNLFPEPDTKYHLSLQPDPSRQVLRQRALLSALTDTRPTLTLMTPWSSVQSLLPPDIWKKACLTLKKGMVTDRDILQSLLIDLGYSRESIVEDPGTFSVRGFTFDLFVPEHDHPLRLEFFDDTVESIKLFHPNTQRSEGEIESVTVTPFSPVIFNNQVSDVFASRVRDYCDRNDRPKRSRDWLHDAFKNRVLFKGLDGLVSFASEEPATLFSYLKPETQVFIADESACLSESSRVLADVGRGVDSLNEEVRALDPYSVELSNLKAWEQSSWRTGAFFLSSFGTHSNDDLIFALKTESNDALRSRLNPATPLMFDDKIALLKNLIASFAEQGLQVAIALGSTTQRQRVEHMLAPLPASVQLVDEGVTRGFQAPDAHFALLTEEDIFGKRKKRSLSSTGSLESFASLELSPGDTVIHRDHGLGRFQSLKRMSFGSFEGEFLILEYRDGDLLYVPVDRLGVLSKFADKERTSVQLDKLGSGQWEKTRAKAKRAAYDYAAQLMELYAQRKFATAPSLAPPETSYEQFESDFPYEETPDQLATLEAIQSDLSSTTPADRLICGDVGFGKTEIAMRAAFRAVASGHQVAVLVPTTLLCLQHQSTFTQRFKNFPVRIRSLSRFVSAQQVAQTVAELKSGNVDIVIGTHRLLSRDVSFHRLGLLVVDEEQRFGVTHKERLRQLSANVHTLTLTATPIPRTLHFSLMGLRDISIINTPPNDRLSVRTYVCPFDNQTIKDAIQSELKRAGQVFIVNPRVEGLEDLAHVVRELIPEARVSVAHGQMTERALEAEMLRFYNKETDVLICTTIIESGLDVPNANTMIVHQADRFGLSQLYQLRGRIGRSNVRGYCYLTVSSMKKITPEAKKRLHVLQTHSELGAGITVAHYDLDLRGAGELLGEKQSGHIETIGVEAYLDLLNEAVCQLKGQAPPPQEPEIRMKLAAFFPEDYIPDVLMRLRFYRRMSQLSSLEQYDDLELEIRDRFGKLPLEATNMVLLGKCRFVAKSIRSVEITVGTNKILVRFDPTSLPETGALWLSLVQTKPQKYTALADGRLAIATVQAVSSLDDLFKELLALWDLAKK